MNKLIKRARLAGKILRFVPFLRMAGLNGSIVRGVENSKSDIDILIIAKHGRLYTCRAFATFLIGLTGHRRHGKKIAGRLCLNCYLNDRNPDIFPHSKKSALKVARAYKYLIPLVDDGISRKFFRSNKWFDEFQVEGVTHSRLLKQFCFAQFPLRGLGAEPKPNVSAKQSRKLFEKLLSGKLGDQIEQKLMNYQIKRILSRKGRGDELFADKNEIRLHPKNKPNIYKMNDRQKCRQVGGFGVVFGAPN